MLADPVFYSSRVLGNREISKELPRHIGQGFEGLGDLARGTFVSKFRRWQIAESSPCSLQHAPV
jgi:hypothetical protein